MRSRRITSVALSTLAATGGLAAVQPSAAHAAGAVGAVTPTFNANEIGIQGTGDWPAITNSYDFTAMSVLTNTDGTAPKSVTINFGTWTLRLGASLFGTLGVGSYPGTTNFSNATPELELSGDGRACNDSYGSFTIYQLGTNSAGTVTALNASFSQTCGTTGHPDIGFIHYNASPVTTAWTPSTPTPVLTATPSGALGAHASATGFEALPADAQSASVFDFGDGTMPASGTGMAADHTYAGGGHYTITASEYVADGFGLQGWTQSTAVDTVTPGPLTPVLKGSVGDANPTTGEQTMTLDASGTTGAGPGATYSFDFGDGTGAHASSTPVMTRPEWEGTYKVTVTVKDANGKTATSPPQWVTVGDGYHPVTPTRILDTRAGLGVTAKGKTTKVVLTLPDSIMTNPNGMVAAVVLNVTATDTTSSGNVKVYPHGIPAATTSNLNFTPGLTVANLVTVPVYDGKVELDVAGAPLSLIADISGYYTTGFSGAGFAPVAPTRLMDTREGQYGGRVAGYSQITMPVPDSVPADATAVVLNVTAVNTQNAGDLDVYPDVPGGQRPTVSNLNFGANAIVPNLVIVPISADRKIDFYLHSPGSADMLADIEGYFSPNATAKFVPYAPVRILDTRYPAQYGYGRVDSYQTVFLHVGYGAQVPSSALTAGLYNVTVTAPAGPGHVTVYPYGTPEPTVSNLNYTTGQTVPNAVLAPIAQGLEDVWNVGSKTDLIVDFFGYFAQPLASDPPATLNAVAKAAATADNSGKEPMTTWKDVEPVLATVHRDHF